MLQILKNIYIQKSFNIEDQSSPLHYLNLANKAPYAAIALTPLLAHRPQPAKAQVRLQNKTELILGEIRDDEVPILLYSSAKEKRVSKSSGSMSAATPSILMRSEYQGSIPNSSNYVLF